MENLIQKAYEKYDHSHSYEELLIEYHYKTNPKRMAFNTEDPTDALNYLATLAGISRAICEREES